MNHNHSRIAVLSIEKGEELFGAWTTAPIAQVGIYKLLAKEKTDGTLEWAHFVQRDSGMKDRVMRGTVKTGEEFTVVKEAIENNLRRIYGVTLQAADYEISTRDGKKAADTMH